MLLANKYPQKRVGKSNSPADLYGIMLWYVTL